VSYLVHPFERHPSGGSTITNEGNHVVIITGQVTGDRYPEGSRYRGTGVTGTEMVMLTLGTVGEAGYPTGLP
jgi:hypothetical protein